jgi:hypothetical protein
MFSRLRLQKTIIFISLLFAFSFVVEGFHHHDDASVHSDCPICMAGAIYTCCGMQNSTGIAAHWDVSYIPFFEEVVYNIRSLYPAIAYRAPPSASLA